MEIDTEKMRSLLQEEQAVLEKELASVGHRNPSNPKDWEATQGDTSSGSADRNEAADGFEQYEEHSAILNELETRYNNVLLALKKLDEGGFGICEVGGEKIEADRLDANPAARTCKAHINEELPNV